MAGGFAYRPSYAATAYRHPRPPLFSSRFSIKKKELFFFYDSPPSFSFLRKKKESNQKTLPSLGSTNPPNFEVKKEGDRFGLPEIFIPC
jgi:hypothetical protein